MVQLKPLTLALAAGVLLLVAAIAYRAGAPELAAPGGATGAGPAPTAAGNAATAQPGAAGAKGGSPDAVDIVDALGHRLDAARLFELGFAGGLVIDGGTRASIEAVINSLPDPLSEQDLQRLERTLREGLPKDDAERAIKLFTDYRAYTADVQEQMAPLGIPSSLQEANAFFDRMEAIKQRHFDAGTAQALFGPHDAYARITMEAMFVEQDASLTPEQKKARLDALRAQLPPDQRSLIPPPAAASQPAS